MKAFKFTDPSKLDLRAGKKYLSGTYTDGWLYWPSSQWMRSLIVFRFLGPARTVNTWPKEFINAALFLRLGLPSTLTHHENGTFRIRASNRRNLKTLELFVFMWKKNILKTESAWGFENDGVSMITWFLSFPQIQIQNSRWLLSIHWNSSGVRSLDGVLNVNLANLSCCFLSSEWRPPGVRSKKMNWTCNKCLASRKD